MPWQEKSVKDQREEFVLLARAPDANIAELCRRFKISRQTGYKWLGRYDARAADGGLGDRNRKPLSSPTRSSPQLEQQVLALRAEEGWGARKIATVLGRDLAVQVAPSTAHSILLRNGCISEQASQAATRWERFEHEAPNDLWQIDFKGHFALGQGRCHALTVIDDHSRYNLVLKALKQETREEVQKALTQAFERYGMPSRINADNGPPWGSHVRLPGRRPLTQVGVWLIRLGIDLSHSRPYHPQTNGKDERFHRTLKAELLARRHLADLPHAQQEFDIYRHKYNYRRPHESLQMKTPSERYRSSKRTYPAMLPPIEYQSSDWVRKVDESGWFSFKGQPIKVSKSLSGYPVGVRADPADEQVWQVFFCHARIATFKLNDKQTP